MNRELSVLRAALTWWRRQGWITTDLTRGLHRRPAPPNRTSALTEDQLEALWHLDARLRDKTYWKMLYESAGRENELLC